MQPLISDVRFYLLTMAIAVGVGVAGSIWSARRAGLPMRRYLIFEALLASAAIAGAKLFYVNEQHLWGDLPEAALSLAGFRYPGGILAVVLVLPISAYLLGLAMAVVADVVAIPISVAMALMRIGCFLEGCCFGVPTTAFVGMRFPAGSLAWDEHVGRGLIDAHAPSSLPVHPLQLYFCLWSTAVALVLWSCWRSRRYPGQIFLLFLALNEGGKAALESLRDPPSPALQLTSAVLAAVAVLGLIAIRSKQSGSNPTSEPAVAVALGPRWRMLK
jgi:phosphatidylglycerol:prolipoprotein diacylglycerol transferase